MRSRAVLQCLCAIFASSGCGDDRGERSSTSDSPINRAPGVDAAVDAAMPSPGTVNGLDFELVEITDGLDRPTAIAFVPGADDELLVLEQDRRIVHLRLRGERAERLGSAEVPRAHFEDDCGLIDLAFDPDFADNGLFFVSMCVSQRASGVFRLRWDGEFSLIGQSLTEILVVGDDRATRGRHNVGALGFDVRGNLWALFGEKTRGDNARNVGVPLGGAVVLSPNREPDGAGFEPADEAPFFDEAGADPTLYATGLRSPWRGSIDERGRIWVGDVGEGSFEEVDLITGPGLDFGWPAYEGPCRRDCDGLAQPLAGWHRHEHDYVLDDPEARPTTRTTVWVGASYQDRGDDPYDGLLTGRMLVSDMCLGFVRLLEADDEGALVLDVHVGNLPFLSGIDQAPDGHFYVSTFGACETETVSEGAGRLYRVVGR